MSMAKRKYYEKRRPTRLERVESKCDRILSELLILRHSLVNRPSDIDVAIERMHNAAKRMRVQCERERATARDMIIKSRSHESR